MCSADQIHIMLLQEARHHIRPKRKRHPSIILRPPRNILVRIRPQQIAKKSYKKQKKTHNHVGWCGSSAPIKKLWGLVRKRNENAPVSGTSVGRMTLRICSIDCRSGLRPPCIVKIFSSIMAAMGRQLKQSVNVFHNLILYRRLPNQKK